MQLTIQGVTVAVKKTAKKSAKKSPAKKSAVKKSAAKKKVAKKSVAKRSAVKKTAKKATKKAAKKAPAKRTAKKSAARKSASRYSVPPVPISSARTAPRVDAPAAPISTKPVSKPKQSTSANTVWIVVIGIVALAAIVWANSSSSDNDAAPTPSESAMPSESATPTPSESTGETVSAVEAPTKFVALPRDTGLKLRWVAPMAVDGLTGFKVETRANGTGDWSVIAEVPADQLTQDVVKSGDTGWTQFRVSSVYSDGQVASATVFGIPGEFK